MMSVDGSTQPLEWGEDMRVFRLAIGQLLQLEDKCKCGVLVLFNRLATGQWLISDVRETLRLGLIGAGVPAADAHRLLERYLTGGRLAESAVTALEVLTAALSPPENEPATGKDEAADKSAFPPPTSTGTALQ